VISHVPLAHGPVGEGDGVDEDDDVTAVVVTVLVGSDADVDPELLDRPPAVGLSEAPEEHDVRAASTQATTPTTAAADDVLLRIMIPLNPRHPPPGRDIAG
jgi:hypothetical protein